VLLPEKAHAIDHLLGSGARGIEAVGETRILFLEKLNALGGYYSLHSGGLEALDPRLRLQRAATERRELVTQMLHQLLQLRERGSFRTYAV
jgi:hypothetical protein